MSLAITVGNVAEWLKMSFSSYMFLLYGTMLLKYEKVICKIAWSGLTL